MKTRTPVEIRRLDSQGVQISWSDGLVQKITCETLRKNCPCAACREARGDGTHAQPLTGKKSMLTVIKNTKEEELRLEEIWQVGQYAVGMRWADGHSTGIYTYEYLAQLI